MKKIGILGLGSIGSRHFENFKNLGCEVRGYDPKRDSNIERNQLLAWADAFVIASPTIQHCIDAFDCEKEDKPCFVEKPIIATVNQALPINHKVLMVGYNLRFHSCVKRARAWLGEGLIGKPLWARFTAAQYSDKADYIRDGLCLNWSHEIDLALFLLGHATMMTSAGDDQRVVDIILNHDVHHCQTLVHLDYISKWERRGFLIVGEIGSIEVDLVMRQAFLRDNKGSLPEIYYDRRGSYDRDYVAEARAFLDRLDGHTVDGCTADEAMHVANICLLAKENMK
jgi:predicted dehydrogenase